MLKNLALSFTAIFVALDIIGVLPMYVSMTHGMSSDKRRRIVDTSMMVAFVVALVFVFCGQKVFEHLGITIFDFKVAGGLILLLVALADLLGGPSAIHQAGKSEDGPRGGIVPWAVPLITGPGVLTQVLLQIGTFGYTITLLALAANYLLAWVLLRRSETVTRWIGRDGILAISKIAALLLAAIAISMIRSGVFEAVLEFRKG